MLVMCTKIKEVYWSTDLSRAELVLSLSAFLVVHEYTKATLPVLECSTVDDHCRSPVGTILGSRVCPGARVCRFYGQFHPPLNFV